MNVADHHCFVCQVRMSSLVSALSCHSSPRSSSGSPLRSIPPSRYDRRVSPGGQSEPARRAARIRALLENSNALISKSRQLREQSLALCQDNADLREFLRETMLNVRCRREAAFEEQ